MTVRLFAVSAVLIIGMLTVSAVRSRSVCSFGTTVFHGGTAHLSCTKESDHMIRLFRGSNYRNIVYTGTELNHRLVDDRYDVRNDGNGSVDLYITAVKPTDAAVYMCYDMKTDRKAITNLVVVEPDHTMSFSLILHGQLEPTVEWMDEFGHVMSDVCSQTNVTDHKSTTNDPSAVGRRLTFDCGNSKSWPCMSSDQNIQVLIWAIAASVVALTEFGAHIICWKYRTNRECTHCHGQHQYENVIPTDETTTDGLLNNTVITTPEDGGYSHLQYSVYETLTGNQEDTSIGHMGEAPVSADTTTDQSM